MKVQPILRSYTILLNWEKEGTSILFNFSKLNPPPFTTYFGKSPYMDSPVKIKKCQPPSKRFFRAKKSTPP